MGVSLTKGQTVDLTKAASDAGSTLTKLVAGAGWDAAAEGQDIDLDLMAVMLGDDGKAIADENGNGSNADEALVFFNNLEGVKGAKHSGDNLTGAGDGDDEQITLTLADLPANVKEVAIVVASYSGQTFGQVKSAAVRLVNAADNTELATYELTEKAGEVLGVELGRVVRNGDSWEFKATSKALEGDFKAIVASYGVN